jgi:hypothetical protein
MLENYKRIERIRSVRAALAVWMGVAGGAGVSGGGGGGAGGEDGVQMIGTGSALSAGRHGRRQAVRYWLRGQHGRLRGRGKGG